MRLPDEARAALEDAVTSGDVPGGVAAVVDADGHASLHAAGHTQIDGPATRPETRYDLASLTKVVATLPSVLRLVADGLVGLDDRVGHYFSQAGWFQDPSLADRTVRQLLTHSAGLRAWEPLFARLSCRRTALAAVLQAPVTTPGSVVYSDLGFMLLGALVERVTGERLDDGARALVFAPLGLERTGFGPIDPTDVAATEDCGWRGKLLVGEVHDENATVWDGVAGHAGVFADARDLAQYAAAWLRHDTRLAHRELLDQALTPQARGADGSVRGLGWLLPYPEVFSGAIGGAGHTGFTGTSMWIDPEAGVASVLLTNRVHPSRHAGAGIAAVRRRFHGAVHGGPSAEGSTP